MSDDDTRRQLLALPDITSLGGDGGITGPCPRCDGSFAWEVDDPAHCGECGDVTQHLRERVQEEPPECPLADRRGTHNSRQCVKCQERERWVRQEADQRLAARRLGSECEELGSSWKPLDVLDQEPAPEPSVGTFAPGQHLLTAGQLHGVHGASDSGKTWLCYIAAAQQLKAGNAVLVVDYEMGRALVYEWLRLLGVSDEQVREGLVYVYPDEPFDRSYRHHLEGAVSATGRPLTLALVDSVGESMASMGMSTNDDTDTGAWLQALPKWMVKEWPSAAVVIIDHSVKGSPDSLDPIGSHRKKAGVHTQFRVMNEVPFSKEHEGHSRVTVAKNRGGRWARGTDLVRIDGGPSGVSLRPWVRDPSADDDEAFLRSLEKEGALPGTQGAATRSIPLLQGGMAKHGETVRDRLTEQGLIEWGKEGQAVRHRLTEAGVTWLRQHVTVDLG